MVRKKCSCCLVIIRRWAPLLEARQAHDEREGANGCYGRCAQREGATEGRNDSLGGVWLVTTRSRDELTDRLHSSSTCPDWFGADMGMESMILPPGRSPRKHKVPISLSYYKIYGVWMPMVTRRQRKHDRIGKLLCLHSRLTGDCVKAQIEETGMSTNRHLQLRRMLWVPVGTSCMSGVQ